MRSTRFLVVSILFHAFGVMALTMSPRSITPETSPGTVEVKIGEVESQAGQAQAKAEVPEEKPVEKVATVKAAPAKAHIKKVTHAVKPKAAKVAAVATPSEDPEAPVVEVAETSTTEPTETTETAKEEPVEEKLVPIKDSVPAGVEAATAEEPVPAQAPSTAAIDDTTADTAKGGSTKESAVSYLDLKQMNGNPAPTYPMQARLENRQGTLELLYRVTKEGKVTDVQVAKSSGSNDLDASAVAAISNFKFVPGQEGWARHPVVFSLKGAVATIPSRLRVNSGKQAQSE